MVGLALGTGVIELRLLPETKSNRTKVADIVIAYACASGLSLGLWIKRLRRLWPDALADTLMIRGSTGIPWTSHYFRTHYLYAWLHRERRAILFCSPLRPRLGIESRTSIILWERTDGAAAVHVPNAPMVL
jgi:hypothetical protein